MTSAIAVNCGEIRRTRFRAEYCLAPPRNSKDLKSPFYQHITLVFPTRYYGCSCAQVVMRGVACRNHVNVGVPKRNVAGEGGSTGGALNRYDEQWCGSHVVPH
jgi:hypothetical protein